MSSNKKKKKSTRTPRKPTVLYAPPALPGPDPSAGFTLVWDWISDVLEYIWREAWKAGLRVDGETSYKGPDSIDLVQLSQTTRPHGVTDAARREVSADMLVGIRERSFRSIRKVRLKTYWFLCRGLGLDPHNLRGSSTRATQVKANYKVLTGLSYQVSDSQSNVFGKFLRALREDIEALALATYPGSLTQPNFIEWGKEAQVSSSMLRNFWHCTHTSENISLFDLWCACYVLDDKLPHKIFGAA